MGVATAVITQTGGAAMNATTVWVSAHLTASQITCGSAQLPYGAIRRIFAITPANAAGVTADLTLSYYDGALNSKSGSNTWAGNVTVAATGTRIGAESGATLVVAGVIDDGGETNGLTVRSADGEVVEVSGLMVPLLRKDVAQAYRANYAPLDEWCGFVCLAPLPTA